MENQNVEITMPTEDFSLIKANELYETGLLKDNLDCKEYVGKYFYPLTNGNHVMYNATQRKFDVLPDDIIRKVYMCRLPKDISKWHFNERRDVREYVCEPNTPIVMDKKINGFGQWKHKKKDYSLYSDEVKNKVNEVIQFFKEVWCSDRDDVLEHLIKFFANISQGKKNDAALYLKSIQGIGKSTGTDFLRKYVFGEKITHKCGSKPIKSNYNMELFGMVLVVFEELEAFTKGEWDAISGRMNDMITSNTMTYEAKYINPYPALNLNNYVVNTNVEAIKGSNGRRWFEMDLSSKYKNKDNFWEHFYELYMNDAVGEAFFNYLLSIDVAKFNPQKMPETTSKNEKFHQLLHHVYQFVKFEYIYKHKDIFCPTKEFFTKYETYCHNNDVKNPLDKLPMMRKLKDVGIIYYSSGPKTRYKVSYERLLEIAEQNKWLTEFDGDEVDNDVAILKVGDDLKELKTKNEQIAELQRQVKELQEKLNAKQTPTETTEENKQEEDNDPYCSDRVEFRPKEIKITTKKKITEIPKQFNQEEEADNTSLKLEFFL